MAGTVINRGNNKWELRISMGYDSNGKQIRKTKRVTATSMRTARKALDEFYLEITCTPRGTGEQMFFKDFVTLWDTRHNSKKAISTRTLQMNMLSFTAFEKGVAFATPKMVQLERASGIEPPSKAWEV